MSDPLTIVAGVVGILTAAAQISTLLINFTKASKNAPSRARHIIAEVNDISGTLSHLQSFLLGNEYSDTSRTSLLKADHIVTILSGCVMTFSELEKLLDALETKDMRILDSMKWARKEKDITALIQRLQNHKTSLSLMLDILNGLVPNPQHQRAVLISRSNTMVQAKASVDRLHDIVNKCYQEMSTRLHALELKELQRTGYAASILDDNASIRSNTFIPNIHPSSELNQDLAPEIGTIDFLEELKRSRVYSRNSAFRTPPDPLSPVPSIDGDESAYPSKGYDDNETSSIVTIEAGSEIGVAVSTNCESNSQIVNADAIFGTPSDPLSPLLSMDRDESQYPCKGCDEVRCSTPLHSETISIGYSKS